MSELRINADSGAIKFGADYDIELTHNADKGLIIKHTATADDKPVILTLQTGETDIAADDVIGKIEFQAPDEGTGTDAILVAAGIQAVSEGDFSSSNNATKLSFMTGASEAATEKMSIASSGATTITVADNSDTLTLTSTDADANSAPNLVLYRNSGSPADSDQLRYIHFDGRNDNSQDVTYYKILSHIADASDGTEDANVQHQVMTNGSLQNYLSMNSGEGEVCINDGQIDLDFRVESDGNGNMFIVDAGAESVNIGTGSDLSAACGIGSTGERALFIYQGANSDVAVSTWKNVYANGSNTATMLQFTNSDNTEVGTIKSTGSATAYNTSSDYRLKENVDYSWDATTRLKQLKPARFNWIADDTNTLEDGFLAHEVSSIVPEAISGTKDAATTLTKAVIGEHGNVLAENIEESAWTAGKADGTYDAETTWHASKTEPKYQQIDLGKLVPLLVKTIQELEARITTLEG